MTGMSNSIQSIHGKSLSSSWVVDSGTTSHIANFLDLFNSYQSLSNKFVLLPNNSKISVSAIGLVSLGHHITLENVPCILEFHINLLSVSSLLNSSSYSCVFTDKHFLIQDTKKQKVIGRVAFFKASVSSILPHKHKHSSLSFQINIFPFLLLFLLINVIL